MDPNWKCQWSRRLERCKVRREDIEQVKESSADEARATFELLKRAPVLYLRQNDEERACLLRTLVSNCVVKGEDIDPIYRKPFDTIAIGVRTGEWWSLADDLRTSEWPKAEVLEALCAS